MIKRNFDLNYGREIIFQWIDDYTKKFDPQISKILSKFFPQVSVSIFLLVERTSKEGLFIEILKKENFETNYYLGDRNGFQLP